ncbi:protein PLASTID MOVEMENT IMPAIRED 1-RELATED 1 [Sesamum alatum]|uniref:Protein PLASTID MOVEMENT IMPAIRED 1-RELATED 1 n=1 Tax=Sesamum alatum TaxID=300844 RepID=A0AAE2CSG5_9LAMI|nr:protein PLASTID MOVEMENT IMPAIRED 1-RELATED 1 [Sesamum alatum]
MLSKAGRKKSAENLESGKFVRDLETISKALHVGKTRQSLDSSVDSSSSKAKQKDATKNKKDSSNKEKKPPFWSWKGLKALTTGRGRRFNCRFTLLVHSIEGLPPFFDDVCLLVHWKRRDSELATCPVKVYQGVAEFEQQLTHSCSIYGSKSKAQHSAKYEAMHFMLYASIHNVPEIDLGKHRVDLTRLLPLSLEELQEEKSTGKWTTSFRLSGRARGAIMNVSFGYVVIGNNSMELSSNSDLHEIPSLRHSATTGTVLCQFDQKDELSIRRVGSLPDRLSIYQSPEDMKDLHEVFPMSSPELCESVNILYQKLDEDISNASTENKLDNDTFLSYLASHKQNSYRPPDAGEEVSGTEWEISEFSVVEKGIEVFPKEKVKSEEDPPTVAQASKEVLETDCALEVPLIEDSAIDPSAEDSKEVLEPDCALEVPNNEDAAIHPSAEDSKEVLETDCALEVPNNEDGAFHPSAEDSKEVLETDCALEVPSNEDGTIHPSAEDSKEVLESDCALEVPNNDDGAIHPSAEASKEVLETDCAWEVPLNEDAAIHPSAEEIVSVEDKQLIGTYDSKEKENGMFSELIIKELETALSYATELMNEGLDSQEDESDALHLEKSLDINSHCRDHREEISLGLDDLAESVASDFLDILGIEHSPFGLSSEGEPESPRERLLKEFERDIVANGGLLNFGFENDPAELVSNMRIDPVWEAISNDFHQPSICEVLQGMPMPKIETDAFRIKTRASRLEDLETEALMRDWGLNEKAFEHSPPTTTGGFSSLLDIPPQDIQQLPPLAEGLGPFIQTRNGGFLRSMNPALFRNAKAGGRLLMQVSSPVVVPAEMGSGVMDILQCLAAVGMEKLSMQANKLMPLEDITGKTIQQIAWEAASSLEGPERQGLLQHEYEIVQNISSVQNSVKGISSGHGSGKSDSTLYGTDTEYVCFEDLAPLAMDKIEALTIEGLRLQSDMSDEDAPSNISSQSIGEFSALKGKTLNVSGSMGLDGTGGLQLLDIKDNGEDVDGLMSLSLTLDEWMKLDSGEFDDNDLISERTCKLLAAHHATSLDLFKGRPNGDKRRGRGRKYGLLGNHFTFALMVQLRDPFRNYEPVGARMLALIQVERVFVLPKPIIYCALPLVRNHNEEEEEPEAAREDNIVEEPITNEIHEEELIPQYKIAVVHVAGLNTTPGKSKLWGSKNQQQSGSRWLIANGMGKKNKHPLMKSKTVIKHSAPASSPVTTTIVQPGDTLWSISSHVHATEFKLKELPALKQHIRNPNITFPNEPVRLH